MSPEELVARVRATREAAEEAARASVTCPTCGESFAHAGARVSHELVHRPSRPAAGGTASRWTRGAARGPGADFAERAAAAARRRFNPSIRRQGP